MKMGDEDEEQTNWLAPPVSYQEVPGSNPGEREDTRSKSRRMDMDKDNRLSLVQGPTAKAKRGPIQFNSGEPWTWFILCGTIGTIVPSIVACLISIVPKGHRTILFKQS